MAYKNYIFSHDCLHPDKGPKPSANKLADKIASVARRFEIMPGERITDDVALTGGIICGNAIVPPGGVHASWQCTRTRLHSGNHAGSPGRRDTYGARYVWTSQSDILGEE